MKGSLITSTALHVLILGFALSSFSAPRTLEVADVEALPVDIVPIESITQIQEGEKDAPLAEKSVPTPTERPDPVKDSQNVGDNKVDLESDQEAKPSEREVIAKAPPKPSEVPTPSPKPEPEPVAEAKPQAQPEAEPKPEPKPEPMQEPVAKPEPQPEPQPVEKPTEVASLPPEPQVDPVAEAIENAQAKPDFEALPSVGPVPKVRPKREKPVEQSTTSTASVRKSDFNADEVAALLNKEEAQGGGARRSTETASLGGSKFTRGATLTQSEMDALRGQIQKYWNIIPGMADGQDVRVTVTMRLDPQGNILGSPEVVATGGSPGTRGTLAGSARRAVLRAQPYQLPAEKYQAWSDVVVHFDPSQMF